MVDCLTQNHTPLHCPDIRGPKHDKSEVDNGTCIRAMYKEANRLKSYKDWPCKFVTPEQLAKAGFYYTNYQDYVRCAFCGVEVGRWEEGDDPLTDHHRWTYGKCPFLHNQPCGNITIEEDPEPMPLEGQDTCGKYGIEFRPHSHPERECESVNNQVLSYKRLGIQPSRGPAYPKYALLEKRLETFAEWPPSIKQRPKELSEAGFFYNQKGDQTICFYCGGGLKNWVEEDDPWEQHARWFPKCGFVRLQKGDQYISDICNSMGATLTAEQARGLQSSSSATSSMGNGVNGMKDLSKCQNASDPSAPMANLKIKEHEPAPTVKETHTKELDPAASSKSSSSSSNTSTMCKICYSKEVGVMFLPCGHVAVCIDCAPALSTCAICRRPLEASVRAFLS